MTTSILPYPTSPAFSLWFEGSLVAQDDGRPTAVYHGTHRAFAQFRPLSHFGTFAAAHDRLRHRGQGAVLVEAFLSIKAPVILSDRGFLHTPSGMIADLLGSWRFYEQVERLGISAASMDQTLHHIAQKPTTAKIVRILSALGFDGICYNNSMEDRGSLSWVVFAPHQVWRAGALVHDPSA